MPLPVGTIAQALFVLVLLLLLLLFETGSHYGAPADLEFTKINLLLIPRYWMELPVYTTTPDWVNIFIKIRWLCPGARKCLD